MRGGLRLPALVCERRVQRYFLGERGRRGHGRERKREREAVARPKGGGEKDTMRWNGLQEGRDIEVRPRKREQNERGAEERLEKRNREARGWV